MLTLKKLVSTSFAYESKNYKTVWQPTLFETSNPIYDADRSAVCGKIFVIDRDANGDGRINIQDLEWQYLEGTGDFRSEEVTRLRDEADIIVTNPPFSLFREFMAWLVERGKQFIIIANKNCVTYKEIFPLFQQNLIWSGRTGWSGGMWFSVPDGADYDEILDGKKMKNVPSIWITNINHGRRHEPLMLISMADNLKYSRHKDLINKCAYAHYDNYDAIEVPYTDAIPSDYEGIMGVPISFLEKYCPEQYEILGATQRGCHDLVPDTKKYDDYWEVTQDGKPTGSSGNKTNENANIEMNDGKKNYFINNDGKIIQSAYQRIFIRKRKQ